MSKISEIFDDVNAEIQALLGATQFQIPDVLALDVQSPMLLASGFGVVIGPAVNTNRQLDCQLSIERNFGVILTERVAAHNTDTTGFSNAQKAILEKQFILIKNWEREVSLANRKAKILFVADGGIEVLTTETQAGRFLVLTSEFSVEYFEDITT